MTLRKPPRPKRPHIKLQKGAFLLSWPVDHDPDDLCGGRRLRGAEFKARKAELEARDRAERALRVGLSTDCHELPRLSRTGEGHQSHCLPVKSRSLLKVLADSSAGLAARRAAATRNRSTAHEARP